MSVATCAGCNRTFTTHEGLTLHQRRCIPWQRTLRRIRNGESLLNPRQLRTMHMGVEKAYLLDHVMKRDDWRDFFDVSFANLTREQAIASIRNDRREVFCSCACKKNPDGSCSGEPSEEE